MISRVVVPFPKPCLLLITGNCLGFLVQKLWKHWSLTISLPNPKADCRVCTVVDNVPDVKSTIVFVEKHPSQLHLDTTFGTFLCSSHNVIIAHTTEVMTSHRVQTIHNVDVILQKYTPVLPVIKIKEKISLITNIIKQFLLFFFNSVLYKWTLNNSVR